MLVLELSKLPCGLLDEPSGPWGESLLFLAVRSLPAFLLVPMFPSFIATFFFLPLPRLLAVSGSLESSSSKMA